MTKNKYAIISICLIFLLSLGVNKAIAANEVSMTTSDIKFETDENYDNINNAYLYIGLRNSGKSEVTNLSLLIYYYTKDNYLIEKVKIENVLTEPIPPGEEKKYKIYLGSDSQFSYDTLKYPFGQIGSVHYFKTEITDVKVNFWKGIMQQPSVFNRKVD